MLQSEWITQAGLAFECAGYVRLATLVSDGAGVADVTLYDGFNDGGQPLGTFSALADDSRIIIESPGVVVLTGLYVDVGLNVQGLLISWEPME